MKKIFLVLIVCTMVIQASIQAIIMINWKINQTRITELYCINKDNPLMHCNGKCYLSKQLKKIEADYKESQNPPSSKIMKTFEVVMYFQENNLFSFNFELSKENNKFGGSYLQISTDQSIQDCFHPPKFIS